MNKDAELKRHSSVWQSSSYFRVLCLALGPAVGLGLGRFAYALLLPAMSADLGWSYAGAGWMNTINALGYLVGALLAAPIARRISLRKSYVAGLVVVVVGTFATALSGNFVWLSGARLATGIAGALVFVSGGVMVAGVAGRDSWQSSFFLGTYYAGVGFGLAVSGLLVPWFTRAFGSASWPTAWIVLGVVAAFLSIAAAIGAGSADLSPPAQDAPAFSIRRNGRILAAYAIFGAGSISYMTFMFARLAEIGASAVQLSGFWSLIGLAAMAAPWIWTSLIARTENGTAFAVLTTVNMVGAAIPLMQPGLIGAWLSAIVFGCSFFTVVAATTAYVQRNARPSEYSEAIGTFTVAFGLGQSVGPFGTGTVADVAGSLALGLGAGCVMLFSAAILGASQHDPGFERG